MTIRWTDICPVLVQVFTEIAADTELPATGFKAEWKEGQRGFTSDNQKLSLLLKVTSVVGIGTDETRDEYVDPTSTNVADRPYLGRIRSVQVGQRKFTLQVQALVPEHTDGQWAMAATERIRTRLLRPRISEKLLTVGVALIEIRPANKVSFKDNGRVVSSATMDIIFATVVNDVDPVPSGWIEAIHYTSHIEDGSGAELPVPPNVTAQLVPSDWTPPS
jgi:hypothetical protein